MADNLPYMVSPGVIPKILGKITEARRPERFTQDFLETKLGHSGGSARPIIPLLKRLGFLHSDGSPTTLYDKFRNPGTQGEAMAEGIRTGYKELFDRNEYAYELSREKLQGLILEMTGLEKDNRAAQSMVATFFALKEFADFEAEPVKASQEATVWKEPEARQNEQSRDREPVINYSNTGKSMGFNVAYTINLNLPETTNPDVFNAIFKSLKENLLDS